MNATHVASVALVVAGTVVIVASSIGALAARNLYHRLHFTTPITSLGGPLLAVGLSVGDGAGLTTASVLLPTFLLFVTGPVLNSAIGRLAAQSEGRIDTRPPE
jgi:multisubunit Na+/H+ antiporter MnhG subunit